MTPNVVGLDLSLTATGFAHDTASGVISVKTKGVERLADLRERIRLICIGADLVVLEDYAFSRAAAHSHELGELGGVIRLMLHDAEQAWVAVGPSALKKYATGKGNANKSEMLGAAIRRLGYPGDDDNEADAWHLRQMGLDALGFAPVVMPAAQRASLSTVSWPDLVFDEVSA